MDNLNTKRYIDLRTNENIAIHELLGNTAIMSNGKQVEINRLNDSDYFEEIVDIDPESIMNKSPDYSSLLKTIEFPENYDENNQDSSPPIIEEVDTIVEQNRIAEKYKNLYNNVPTHSVQNSDDISNDFNNEPPDLSYLGQLRNPEDPIITMFRNCKRNTEFKFSVDIENKIPRLDFIEMMEDSYEVSIVDFLANEFVDNLIQNRVKLKEQIKEQIFQLIENKPHVEKRKNSSRKKTQETIKKIEEND